MSPVLGIHVSTFPAQDITGNEARVCPSLRDGTESMTLARLTAEPFAVLTRGSIIITRVSIHNPDVAV